MTQAERRLFLIRSLMKEKTEYRDLSIPAESGEQKRLRCGAIVNAANSGMTGCYIPCHACIDNCIHTYAGVQLRLECARLMAEQGHAEPTGQAKLTRAYDLPCDYVLHTVGPIVEGRVTAETAVETVRRYKAESNSALKVIFNVFKDTDREIYRRLLAG